MSQFPARRHVMHGAAWTVPALALVAQAPARASSAPVDCTINWVSTSTLAPHNGDVSSRDKTITDGGDLSIDGWDSTSAGSASSPMFRIVLGTLVPLSNVVATVTVTSGNMTFGSPGAGYTPAGGATPADYKLVNVPDPGTPAKTASTTIGWSIPTMPANSSAGFNVAGIALDPANTTNYVVTIMVSATKTGVAGCP